MYTKIKVQCIDQQLTMVEEPVIASGSKNADIVQFNFCSMWDEMAKTAVFWHERNPHDVYHAVIDINNECVIPHEVLRSQGKMFFGIQGIKGDVRRTSTVLAFNLKRGIDKKGVQSAPTKTVYEQILSDYATCVGLMESIVSDARIASEAAAKASVDAQNAAVSAQTAAKDAANDAINAAKETVDAAVEAAEAAQAAAEEASATARGEVLGMGVVLAMSGTYVGNGEARTVELPISPKLLHIFTNETEPDSTSINDFADQSHVTMMNGQKSRARQKMTSTSGGMVSYIASVELSGNKLIFTKPNKTASMASEPKANYVNVADRTYEWFALYQEVLPVAED